MDKRWLGILIIVIAGLACMYLIVDSSNTVGKAVTVVDEMTVTLPSGFNILKSTDKSVHLLDHQNNTANITIKGLGDNSSEFFKNKLKSLKDSGEVNITDTTENSTAKVIFYKNLTNDKEYSISYFVKDNHTIELKMDKYDNWKDDWDFIVSTVVHNFKQNK
ncbi:MAG: hypothetical protein ILA26_00300 [Methanobrevibacter sp.]|uniref:hypothetical protein n=1 Tax=Methanobrevibacter sp. TaxID=66852 RepID=UPI001B3E973C|nr:hypothetical protein [Methanobrevibacter sp.]MBP3790457.1 hypothetical protein [Methanobrevibacter sp.]